MVGFILKKVIARFLFPLPLGLEVIIIGWLLNSKSRFKKTGKVLIISGVVFLYLISCIPFIDRFMYSFEHQYLPVREHKSGISYIVVLGGGHVSEEVLPPNSQLYTSTLARVVESVRLKKLFPQAKIIYSGGKIELADKKSNAEIMAATAVMLGVPPYDIVLEERAKDTIEEALYLKSLLKDKNFILVTSASHMPRAVLLFKKQGLKPIPSPSSYLTKKRKNYLIWDYFPSYEGVQKSERLFYEILGIVWAKINGYI